MLIFDVSNKDSFKRLDKWLEEFHNNGGKGAVVAVVGNKVSLFSFLFYTFYVQAIKMFTNAQQEDNLGFSIICNMCHVYSLFNKAT